jgi:hypothetical protein
MIPVWLFTDRSLLWPSVVGQIIAAAATYSTGRYLNKDAIKHRFCGIRFEYWGFIMPAISAGIYILDLMLTKS